MATNMVERPRRMVYPCGLADVPVQSRSDSTDPLPLLRAYLIELLIQQGLNKLVIWGDTAALSPMYPIPPRWRNVWMYDNLLAASPVCMSKVAPLPRRLPLRAMGLVIATTRFGKDDRRRPSGHFRSWYLRRKCHLRLKRVGKPGLFQQGLLFEGFLLL